jgi:hypothetical protein
LSMIPQRLSRPQWPAAMAVYFLGLTVWHAAVNKPQEQDLPSQQPQNP